VIKRLIDKQDVWAADKVKNLDALQVLRQDVMNGKTTSVTGPQAEITDFISKVDSDVYNKLNALLGKSENLKSTGNLKAGKFSNTDLDLKNYEDLLKSSNANYVGPTVGDMIPGNEINTEIITGLGKVKDVVDAVVDAPGKAVNATGKFLKKINPFG
jgi:hypothetical protein